MARSRMIYCEVYRIKVSQEKKCNDTKRYEYGNVDGKEFISKEYYRS